MSQQLLRRAWDALDSFKQAYPENWHEDDEQVMKDLMRTDMKMSGVQPKWVGLTDEDIWEAYMESPVELDCSTDELYALSRTVEAKLKDKNTRGQE